MKPSKNHPRIWTGPQSARFFFCAGFIRGLTHQDTRGKHFPHLPYSQRFDLDRIPGAHVIAKALIMEAVLRTRPQEPPHSAAGSVSAGALCNKRMTFNGRVGLGSRLSQIKVPSLDPCVLFTSPLGSPVLCRYLRCLPLLCLLASGHAPGPAAPLKVFFSLRRIGASVALGKTSR